MASEPDHVPVHGKGSTIDEAIQDAWNKARKTDGDETRLEILRIAVHGSNPISGYSVILHPTR